jgi:hypothetical protein
LKKKQKSVHKNQSQIETSSPSLSFCPSSPSCQFKAFPSSIDHLQILSNRHKVLVKDITGNISSFDVRQLSKVVMDVARSDPARESRIDYSRFYVDDDESMLFTTGIRHSPQSTPSSSLNGSLHLSQRDMSSRPPISVDTVVSVWSLKSEATKLRTIPLSPLLQRIQTKINLVFASNCSSSDFLSHMSSSNRPSGARDGVRTGIEFSGSYFCCKTENTSIFSLQL